VSHLFKVPFIEEEVVWTKYEAIVDAESKEDAMSLLAELCKSSNPHKTLDCELKEVFHLVESKNNYEVNDFTIKDIKNVDNRLSCELSLSTLELINLNYLELCQQVEMEFAKNGLSLVVKHVELNPIFIENGNILYNVIPTSSELAC